MVEVRKKWPRDHISRHCYYCYSCWFLCSGKTFPSRDCAGRADMLPTRAVGVKHRLRVLLSGQHSWNWAKAWKIPKNQLTAGSGGGGSGQGSNAKLRDLEVSSELEESRDCIESGAALGTQYHEVLIPLLKLVQVPLDDAIISQCPCPIQLPVPCTWGCLEGLGVFKAPMSCSHKAEPWETLLVLAQRKMSMPTAGELRL